MRYVYIIFFLAIVTSLSAQIKINGDFEVRPRYDMNNKGAYGNSTEDMYYMYRARINMKASIGDGWYAKTQLGHAGYGGFGFAGFTRTESQIPGSVEGAIRPGVHFMQLYFGRATKKWGIAGGLIPVNGIANPLLDVHYYPTRIIDIPYAIFSVNAAFGFSGYVNFGETKLNWTVFVDNNEGQYVEAPDEDVLRDDTDCYTLGLDYEINAGGFKIVPRLLISEAIDSSIAPLTAGLSLVTPKAGPFTFSLTSGFSSQSNEGTTEYDIFYSRLGAKAKLGPGMLNVWYDLAKKTNKLAGGDVEHDFGHLWLHYNFTVYKGDKGSVNIGPRLRYGTETADNVKDYERIKIELPMYIKFN